MAFLPNKIIARLTIGMLLILLVTAATIYTVMVHSGEPKLISINTQLTEQSAVATVRQLSIM